MVVSHPPMPKSVPSASVPPKLPAPKPSVLVKHSPATGWLYVYANQNVAPLGQPARMAGIHPQAIYVDGHFVPELTAGHWTAFPAGRHRISFFPDPHSGYSGRTGVTVTLEPQARVSRQVLLPIHMHYTASSVPAVPVHITPSPVKPTIPIPAPKVETPKVETPELPAPHLRNP